MEHSKVKTGPLWSPVTKGSSRGCVGPDRRIALPIRFGVKHRGHPSAFGSDSHAIPQPYACPAEHVKLLHSVPALSRRRS
jgi:hypothetical protein